MDMKEIEEKWKSRYCLPPDPWDDIKWLIVRIKELEGTQWDRIANDLTEAKSENAKLLARVKVLEDVVKLTVASQGWDGNNPDDDRWTKLYEKARASIQKE